MCRCKKGSPAAGIIAAFDFAARRQAPLATLAVTLSQILPDG
jgi:hypothetical protein